MKDECLLALDLGTSGCRAEILALDGRSLGRAAREYGLLCPEPGGAEQDPAKWWARLTECVRQALAEAGSIAVTAVGLSVQGHSWLPAGVDGAPLRHALTWLDNRAEPQVRRLLAEHPIEFWGGRCGKRPGPWHLLPQWLWLREREPQTLSCTRRLLLAHDWLLARLTGSPVTDPTLAAGTLLFDIARNRWDTELLAEYEVGEELLPPVWQAGTLAGGLTAAVAGEWGLPEGLPVAVGAQDQKCAALAAGLSSAVTTASLGTSTAISALLDRPYFSNSRGAIPCFPYVEPGQWVLEAPLTTSGGALRWLRDLLGREGQQGLREMMAEAETIPCGAEGVRFFPYLAGAASPFWRGDVSGCFAGLSLRTSAGHLTRAVLEAVACDIASNLAAMQASGCDVRRLVLFGGGARDPLWPAIIAAICAIPVCTATETEAATRGAAILAARAVGLPEDGLALDVVPVEEGACWREIYREIRGSYDHAREAYFRFQSALREEET